MTALSGLGQTAVAALPPAPTQPPGNPHFSTIGVFKQPTFTILRTLTLDTGEGGPLPTQPETQPHFVGKLKEPKFSLLPALRQNSDFTTSGPLIPDLEVNPHYRAYFVEPRHNILRALYQGVIGDRSSTPEPGPSLPGSGKRYAPPTDYLPEPAWDERPRKPVRPIWDRSGKVHKEEPPPVTPSAPPALPPLSIFGPGQQHTLDLTALPTFGQYEIPRALLLGEKLRDAKARALYDHNEQAIVVILDALDEDDEDE